MRTSEFLMALPWLYLLLGVRAILPLHVNGVQAFWLVIGIIGGVGWVRPARLVRGGGIECAGTRRTFLRREASARRPIYLIRRHVAPLTWGVLLTQATILIPQYILAEVTLSFLGLGVGEPAPSWGNMLAEARQYHALILHPWLLAPGIAAIPVLLGYLILADALLDRAGAVKSLLPSSTVAKVPIRLTTLVIIALTVNSIHYVKVLQVEDVWVRKFGGVCGSRHSRLRRWRCSGDTRTIRSGGRTSRLW